jgi:protein-S-isoprenylcysteine O-methyltransferase Ste14
MYMMSSESFFLLIQLNIYFHLLLQAKIITMGINVYLYRIPVYSGFRQIYTGFLFILGSNRFIQDSCLFWVQTGLYRIPVYSGFRQVYTGFLFILGLVQTGFTVLIICQ